MSKLTGASLLLLAPGGHWFEGARGSGRLVDGHEPLPLLGHDKTVRAADDVAQTLLHLKWVDTFVLTIFKHSQ